MNNINQITYKEIGRLDPIQLVKLLNVLLHAEERKRGVSKAGIHVPLNIVVADGGEDGRWEADLDPSDFIPNRLTVYQSKAEDLGPTACKAEVLKAREDPDKEPAVLKPQVAKVLESNGCYCFFCKTDYNQQQLDERVKKVREALKEAGRPNPEQDQVLFLDGNKIAEWVNQHAGAIAFVLESCNLARTDSFLSWDSWRKQRRDFGFPFETNPYLDLHIKNLREQLAKPRAIARVVGQSGLGKTRLAFEVLRPISQQGSTNANTALTDSMVYFDVEAVDKSYYETIRRLAEDGVAGVVVVDNCLRKEHDRLAKLVTMDGSNLSLLTLDYEPERIESSFTHILLEPEHLEDIIPRLLTHVDAAKRLTDSQREHIAKYCQGFPQIAVLLTESEAPIVVERLTEGEFAEKLLWGRGQPDEQSLSAVKSLSLFRHVGALGKAAKQLTYVSQTFCPAFTERIYREKCHRFQKLRVIQTAGDYWFVSPKPLAVALAAKWWESATTEELLSYIPGIEENGLVEPFCSQLRLLDSSENAKKIVQDLCANNGPFGSAEVMFSKSGSRLFRAIVELNPTAALMALNHAFSHKTLEELRDLTDARRNLVWSLERLCWDAELFPASAQLLLRLAAAENEGYSNNATGQFVQLFQIFLSGTKQPALKRLDVIEVGLSHCLEEQKVCIAALGMALHPVQGHYSRTGGVEVRGSSLPENDWAPRTYSEVFEYQLKAFGLLRDSILRGGQISRPAATELGKQLRTLLIPNYLDRLESEIRGIANHLDNYWPSARSTIESMLEYKQMEPSTAVDPRVEPLLEVLQPADLELRVRQVVTSPGYRGRFTQDKQFVDLAAEEAEKLGKQVAFQPDQLAKVLPVVLSDKQEQGFAFGVGLSTSHPSPAELVSTCLDILKGAEKPNPAVLGGVLRALGEQPIVHQTLQAVADDPKLCSLFTRLVTLKKLARSDLEWMAKLVREKKLQAVELKTLCYGSVTDSLSPEDLHSTLIPLTQEVREAVVPVYEVYGMYALHNRERWLKCKPVVRELILRPGFFQSLRNSMHAHLWEEQCAEYLKDPGGEEFARNQMEQIVEAQFVPEVRYSSSGPEPHRVAGAILSQHGAACWPIVGKALLREEVFMLSDLLRAHPVYGAFVGGAEKEEQFTCVLWSVSSSILLPWCREHPGAAERLLGFMALFITGEDGSFRWHPTALALLEEFYQPEIKGTVFSNLASFSSTGSRVPYVQRRIDLLRQLESSTNPQLRVTARELEIYFEQDKEAQRKHDEQFRAGIL